MSKLIFKDFKDAVQKQFDTMKNRPLFVVEVEKNYLWNIYLNSFPEGYNKMFRERLEYDCQSCKTFIRACGHMVKIVDNKMVSIWDIDIEGPYKIVADALSKAVKKRPIRNVFRYFQQNAGTNSNMQMLEDGNTIKWEHFFVKLPAQYVQSGDDINVTYSNCRTQKELFCRAMNEITLESAETVRDLIEQNSLYRGEEHLPTIKLFIAEKSKYDVVPEEGRDIYEWTTSLRLGGNSRMKNSVIGTLLVDLSNGESLDRAVSSFESKVAPANYKRPTALITKGMIKQAEKKVEELGIENSLYRRFAVTEDITVNNVLFADREAKKKMGAFDTLKSEVAVNEKKYSKVEEVSVDKFIKDILPNVDSVEMIFENRHINNLMSLIAPMQPDTKNIFQWHNNFSWAYNGDVTDSIKERVKAAGGSVTGVLRCSLGWFNYDDLDIHVIEPYGNEIYYGNKSSSTGGCLDVDMNAGGSQSRNAVENITWPRLSTMKEGKYQVFINQYNKREDDNVGFDAEIEYGGEIHRFHYPRRVSGNVHVAEFTFSKKGGIKFGKSMESTTAKKTVWGISTQQFHKVKLIMNSPNHWDGHKTGNRHVFFILDGCKNDKDARGFFNEFLSNELTKHRKVFEVLGSKLKAKVSDEQLSGLGFSSTKRNSVVCKLSGNFSRTIKINF